jgi:lipopolysaccharide transport system ATP-binding protein
LSVGDIEFQKKCLGKLGTVNKEQGKTILFVSHNMNSNRILCNKGLILEKGQLTYFGDVQNAIQKYTSSIFSQNSSKSYLSFLSNECSYLRIQNIVINNQQSGIICLASGNNSLDFILEGSLLIEKNMSFEFILYDKDLVPLLFYSPGHYEGRVKKYPAGVFSIFENIELPNNINRGEYTASFYLTEPDVKYHIKYDFAVTINIDGYPTKTGQVFDYNNGKGFLFLP